MEITERIMKVQTDATGTQVMLYDEHREFMATTELMETEVAEIIQDHFYNTEGMKALEKRFYPVALKNGELKIGDRVPDQNW